MIRLFFASLILTLAADATAGVRTAPIRLEMSPQDRDKTITVTNTNQTGRLAVHIGAFLWTQAPDQEIVLTKSRGLAFFPPQASLAPGESQTIRVMLRNSAPANYRVQIRELARPGVSGVQTLMNVTLPVFVGTKAWRPALEAALSTPGPGVIGLRITNKGTRFDRILRAEIDGIEVGLNRYILPGSSQQLNLNLPASATGRSITLHTENGHAPLVVSAD